MAVGRDFFTASISNMNPYKAKTNLEMFISYVTGACVSVQ